MNKKKKKKWYNYSRKVCPIGGLFMKRKGILMLTIILMTIGFAAVSTTLFLNGNTNIGTKEEDFDVYFSDVYIDDVQILKTISKDRKTITYETNELKTKGETSILDYEVTNASKQYDAKVEVNCIPKEDEWIHVEAEQTEEIIEARSKGVGKINVTLKQNPLEEMSITFSCTLKVEAIERESIIVDEIAPTEIQTWEFDYTGSDQEFIVPRSGEYKIELWGASYLHKGGYASGVINLEKNIILYVYVGEKSFDCSPYTSCDRLAFNGGGKGGFFTHKNWLYRPWSGSGATDIRLVGGEWNHFDSLKSRIMVVGGDAYQGAFSGGLIGYQGSSYANGTGGTQISGGKASGSGATDGRFGIGGNGYVSDPTHPDTNDGYGAGGGYYGGGGGRGATADKTNHSNRRGSGGSGSSFISGHNGCDAIEEASTEENIIHTGQANHYSGLVFTDTLMIDGAGYKWSDKKEEQVQMPKPDGTLYDIGVGHSGNGYAKITYLGK